MHEQDRRKPMKKNIQTFHSLAKVQKLLSLHYISCHYIVTCAYQSQHITINVFFTTGLCYGATSDSAPFGTQPYHPYHPKFGKTLNTNNCTVSLHNNTSMFIRVHLWLILCPDAEARQAKKPDHQRWQNRRQHQTTAQAGAVRVCQCALLGRE